MVTPRIFRVWRTTYAISTKIARYVYHLNTCHWAIPEKKKQGGEVEGGISRG